jgi:Mg2+/Co2+ transporter CorB
LEDAPTLVLLITLGLLLLVVAFASGTEVAMLSVNRYRIRNRAARGERAARTLEALLAKPDD